MHEKRFYVEGLAHASYLFGSSGEAAVVDPKRDVDDYIVEAAKTGMKIVAIFETHPHADFASGHVELSERTGAKIYISHKAAATYPHVGVNDSTRISIGELEVQVIETPGHSPDSVSFLVKQQGKPISLYTGDTLFVGDVGRPDLRDADARPAALAEALYDSLFHKLIPLPADVAVYPSHGAGSLCGRKISPEPSSTIGKEKNTNWALQLRDRAEFVRRMITNLPARPSYFVREVALNLEGLTPLSKVRKPQKLSEAEVIQRVGTGSIAIDIRTAAQFGFGHLPGSLNIGLASPLFSTWVGFLVAPEKEIILVVDSEADGLRAWLELARIGFDQTTGFIEADSIANAQELSQLSVGDLQAGIDSGSAPMLVDVRTQAEWETNHIPGARHIPLPGLSEQIGTLNNKKPLALICGSGYRSSIAGSLLQAKGFQNLQNVAGGMGAYEDAHFENWSPADLVFLREGI